MISILVIAILVIALRPANAPRSRTARRRSRSESLERRVRVLERGR